MAVYSLRIPEDEIRQKTHPDHYHHHNSDQQHLHYTLEKGAHYMEKGAHYTEKGAQFQGSPNIPMDQCPNNPAAEIELIALEKMNITYRYAILQPS